MMRQVQIVNLNSNGINNGGNYVYPNGVSGLGSPVYTYTTNPSIVHSLQAASMKACADDIIKFYDDNDDLISVFKMQAGMVVQFV